MEINIIEESKKKLVFEIGENVGFINAIKNELIKNPNVKVATYFVKHPLVGKPKIIVETKGADPRKVIRDAIKRLKKLNEKFKEGVKKEIR